MDELFQIRHQQYLKHKEEQIQQEYDMINVIYSAQEKLEKLGKIFGKSSNHLDDLLNNGLSFKEQLVLFLKVGGNLDDAVEIVLRILRGLAHDFHFSILNTHDKTQTAIQQLIREILNLVHLPEDTIIVERSMDTDRDQHLAQQLLAEEIAQVLATF